MSDRYAVAGNPVAHSKSPLIHARFAAGTGQDIEYRRLPVPLDGFAAAVARFFDEGGRGLNVTLPFKEEACRLAATRSERAARAGAANTLALRDGRIHADNTDGAGLLADLRQNLDWPVAAARVLLLGAGGAARGVLGPLLREGPRELVIANRSEPRALALVENFAEAGVLRACAPGELEGAFDLVINASSAGLAGQAPVLPAGVLAPGARCYDMVYANEPTPFMRWAAAAGAAATADGLGMLVEQAAESFLLWRGLRPATAPVIAQLRAAVQIRAAAGAADLQEAARLFREYQAWLGADLCFQGFERELAELPGAYAPPRGALLLAEAGAAPFACVALRPLAEHDCEMKRLYVPETWRGAGLGRRLAEAAIEAARRAGYRRLRLDTLERLHQANALYAALGFRRCEAYYPNPLEGVVYWELELGVTRGRDGVSGLRRFIAGAVCPHCKGQDKLFVRDEERYRICECVACGHRETLDREAPLAAPQDGTESIVRIVDRAPD